MVWFFTINVSAVQLIVDRLEIFSEPLGIEQRAGSLVKDQLGFDGFK